MSKSEATQSIDAKPPNSEGTAHSEEADPAKWLELFGDSLFQFALSRVRGRELAEDLVQETFVSAMRRLDTFEGRSSVKTWLFSILRNKIIDNYRRSGRELLTSDGSTELEAVDGNAFTQFGIWKVFVPNWARSPEDALENKQFLKVLQACIEKLPKRSRSLFEMKYLSGLSAEDICKDLEVSSSNYWVILYRARMALRECVQTNWTEDE